MVQNCHNTVHRSRRYKTLNIVHGSSREDKVIILNKRGDITI